jgi:hypothetical protein
MQKFGMGLATVVALVSALVAPASSGAQTPDDGLVQVVVPGVGEARITDSAHLFPIEDVGEFCHSQVGSGTTNVGPVGLDRCIAAQAPAECAATDTVLVLDLVAAKYGICFDADRLQEERSVKVRGLASVHLLPDGLPQP